VQGTAAIEAIIEHIAHVLKKDPTEIRLNNLIKDGDSLMAEPGATFEGENPIPKMIEEMKVSGDYIERKMFVDNYNKVCYKRFLSLFLLNVITKG